MTTRESNKRYECKNKCLHFNQSMTKKSAGRKGTTKDV
ncbi:hypothetical protein CSC35_0283 [Enterobacter hormaechei]|nr:hypothetical protein CSC35_0283 [Enterobacter hormaechei]